MENTHCSHKRVIELLQEGAPMQALRMAGPLLQNDPGNILAWYLTNKCVHLLGDHETAFKNMKTIAVSFAKAGFPVAAIASALEFKTWGNDNSNIVREIAQLYCLGASRVVEKERTPPAIGMSRLAPWSDDVSDDDVKLQAVEQMAVAWGEALILDSVDVDLPFLPLFSSLDPENFARLVDCFSFVEHAEGARIIQQGDTGDVLFVLSSGTVDVIKESEDESAAPLVLASLGPGAFVGEMALVSRSPRAASVVANVPLQLLKAPKDVLEALAGDSPAVADVLVSFCHVRMLENLIRISPVLSHVPISSRPDLISCFDSDFYRGGDTFIKEGEAGSYMFLIVSGQVSVFKEMDGQTTQVAVLKTGDIFGEISLLLQKPSTATVVADENTAVLKLSRDEFHAVTNEHPELLKGAFDIALKREAKNSSILGQVADSNNDTVLL